MLDITASLCLPSSTDSCFPEIFHNHFLIYFFFTLTDGESACIFTKCYFSQQNTLIQNFISEFSFPLVSDIVISYCWSQEPFKGSFCRITFLHPPSLSGIGADLSTERRLPNQLSFCLSSQEMSKFFHSLNFTEQVRRTFHSLNL